MSESKPADWTVYAAPIHALVQAVESFGGRRELLLREAGIDGQLLEHADHRFPVADLFRLYECAVAQTKNRDLALYVGRISFVNGLNLQLYMSTICNTFREYLNLMPSVLKFTGDIGEVKIRREGELLRLEWLPLEPQSRSKRYLTDTFLANSSAIVDSLCVQPIRALKADFTYPEPSDTTLLRQVFGENLRFSQAVSCLYYERACLTYPITHLDHKLDVDQTDPLLRFFDERKDEDPFLDSLRQSIVRLLPLGDMSIDQVAGELNVSRRTLQRRLSDRETQFLQVLQDIREDLALRYLADERLGITEIAFLLGYADQGSFSSAFKVWQGLSPRDYRRR
jgi:AraC-like DNA-binding protein